MAEVKLENVTKRYGDLEAVSKMTWTANQGEFVVLFGPSGAGKTTTMEMIAGLEPLNEGEIYFGEKPMGEVNTADRNVAMAFENYALYPHMSVFDNIAFPMKIPGRSGNYSNQEVKKRVEEIAAVLQIEMLLDRKPQQLSGGQRQRVALGRCLVREPAVCLLDEPIAHLDAKLRHRMYAELKRIQRERGTTTIYATPAQTEAMAMADRIVVLFEGEVQQFASPRDLYERPGSVAVARFGGEQPMNILPIKLTEDKGKNYFIFENQRVLAPDNLQKIIETNQPAVNSLLGIRPADITIQLENNCEHGITATLYAVEQLGSAARVTVQIGDHFIEVASKGNVEVDANVGDMLWLDFDNSPLYIFDAETDLLVAAAGTEGDTA
jgi:multiple sugar transport system ATP-binding protein